MSSALPLAEILHGCSKLASMGQSAARGTSGLLYFGCWPRSRTFCVQPLIPKQMSAMTQTWMHVSYVCLLSKEVVYIGQPLCVAHQSAWG